MSTCAGTAATVERRKGSEQLEEDVEEKELNSLFSTSQFDLVTAQYAPCICTVLATRSTNTCIK